MPTLFDCTTNKQHEIKDLSEESILSVIKSGRNRIANIKGDKCFVVPTLTFLNGWSDEMINNIIDERCPNLIIQRYE